MRYLFMFFFITLSGCSTMFSSSQQSPVDEALKACGLGYSTEASTIFNAAYQYAERKGNADFAAKMKEGLQTQIMSFATSANISKNASPDKLIDLVKSTQDCVVKFAEAYRPKTRSELLYDCRNDLQKRVSGDGDWPKVKNWHVVKNNPNYSNNNLVMAAFIDAGGTNSRNVLVACEIKNNKYYGLDPLPMN